jgi:hypothetical protein
MQKTKNPDVYNLLSSGTKIDIACIPDMETSKKCKQWFKDNNAQELFVKCRFDFEKKKWIPIELIEKELDNKDLIDNDENIDE